MKAMIFAAGLGTRLKPFTNDRPKALVKVNGMTMLEMAIYKLKNAGIDQIIINLHHFADMIRDYVKSKNSFGIEIAFSDETKLLLDTGGGLKKAKWFLNGTEAFFAYNVDILTDLDLTEMVKFHESAQPLATLAIKERQGNRFFLFDKQHRLRGWKNFATNEEKIPFGSILNLKPFAFSGIHLIDPSLFDYLDEEGIFSIVDVYLRLSQEHTIMGYVHNHDLWMDLGKPSSLTTGEEAIQNYSLERFIG